MTASDNFHIRLPATGTQFDGEQESVLELRRVLQPTFIVREEPPPDFGVDGVIEAIRRIPGQNEAYPTNLRACFQIKHTEHARRLEDGTFSYPIEVNNLNYLNSRQLPALYVLYDKENKNLYMRWHRDVVAELNAKNPAWINQKTVNIHFSQLLSKDALIEIDAVIWSHFEMVSQLYDGPGLIRSFSGEQILDTLIPHYPFVERHEKSTALEEQLTPNCITSLSGTSEVGKTELIAHLLNDQTAITRLKGKFPLPIALLLVDLKPRFRAHSVLRNLAYALGVSKVNALSEVEWPELSSANYQDRLVDHILPARLRGQSVLALFENSQEVLDDELQVGELDQVLACELFRNGSSIVVSHRHTYLTGKNRRLSTSGVHLENLSAADSKKLLTEVLDDSKLALSAIEIIQEIPELMNPGVLMRGVGIFTSRRSSEDTSSGEDLADAIFLAFEPQIRELLNDIRPETRTTVGGPSRFHTLAVMAFFRKLRFTQELIKLAGLSWQLFDGVSEGRWLTRYPDGYQLTSIAANVLRKEIRSILTNPSRVIDRSILLVSLDRCTQTLAQKELESESIEALEEAFSWLCQSVPDERQLQDDLLKLLLPYVVDDFVFPLSEKESVEFRERLQTAEGPLDIEARVAGIVASSRFEIESSLFKQELVQTVKLLRGFERTKANHIRALDIAATILARYQNLHASIIEIREMLIPQLLREAREYHRDAGWLKWSANWLLNTADLLTRSGPTERSHQLLKDADWLLNKLPKPKKPYAITDWNLLRARLRRLEAKVSNEQSVRVSKLRDAMTHASGVLAFANDQIEATRIYLRSVRQLIEELRSDDERVEVVEAAISKLEMQFGERSKWPIYICSQTAALVRNEARLHEDPERQLQRGQVALSWLLPFKTEVVSLAAKGDIVCLLTLARCNAFVASCNERLHHFGESSRDRKEAMKLCKKVLAHKPSATAWLLMLILQDQEDTVNGGSVFAKEISPTLRKLISEARSWTQSLVNKGVKEGRLMLWCLEREYSSQGSLERMAKSRHLEKSWDSLDTSRKNELVTLHYNDRRQKLDLIARFFGEFRDLYLARAKNEIQYQRLLAINGDHQFDKQAVLNILVTASAIWPNDPVIVEEEGRIHRLVWDYPEAIISFRRVRTMTAHGPQRREVTTALIETLLSASIHHPRLIFPNGSTCTPADLITEAQLLLPEVLGFRNVALEASVLRDRVEFEADAYVDWSAIDSAYTAVIGGPDKYLDTVIGHSSELAVERPEFPKNLADGLMQNCTSVNVLYGLGSLYLRRAETRRGKTPIEDCQRAYDAFNACRILDRSWFDAAAPLTSFRRARAIIVAATISNDPNPFPVNLEGKPTALHLADSLLQSVAAKSVGGFYASALNRLAELRQLRQRILGTKKNLPQSTD